MPVDKSFGDPKNSFSSPKHGPSQPTAAKQLKKTVRKRSTSPGSSPADAAPDTMQTVQAEAGMDRGQNLYDAVALRTPTSSESSVPALLLPTERPSRGKRSTPDNVHSMSGQTLFEGTEALTSSQSNPNSRSAHGSESAWTDSVPSTDSQRSRKQIEDDFCTPSMDNTPYLALSTQAARIGVRVGRPRLLTSVDAIQKAITYGLPAEKPFELILKQQDFGWKRSDTASKTHAKIRQFVSDEAFNRPDGKSGYLRVSTILFPKYNCKKANTFIRGGFGGVCLAYIKPIGGTENTEGVDPNFYPAAIKTILVSDDPELLKEKPANAKTRYCAEYKAEREVYAMEQNGLILDKHRSGNKLYLLMPYLESDAFDFLFALKEVEEPYEWNADLEKFLSLKYSVEFMDAVERMHQNHWVNYDVKPENAMLTRDGTMQLIDMGLSAEITTETGVETEPGMIPGHDTRADSARISSSRGTPGYMAPELFNMWLPQAKKVHLPFISVAADQWSCGVCILNSFYAHTGSQLFSDFFHPKVHEVEGKNSKLEKVEKEKLQNVAIKQRYDAYATMHAAVFGTGERADPEMLKRFVNGEFGGEEMKPWRTLAEQYPDIFSIVCGTVLRPEPSERPLSLQETVDSFRGLMATLGPDVAEEGESIWGETIHPHDPVKRAMFSALDRYVQAETEALAASTASPTRSF